MYVPAVRTLPNSKIECTKNLYPLMECFPMDCMNDEQLSDHWYRIAKALDRVIKQLERLPERERDSEFSECLDNAFNHAERRAEALTDPS